MERVITLGNPNKAALNSDMKLSYKDHVLHSLELTCALL